MADSRILAGGGGEEEGGGFVLGPYPRVFTAESNRDTYSTHFNHPALGRMDGLLQDGYGTWVKTNLATVPANNIHLTASQLTMDYRDTGGTSQSTLLNADFATGDKMVLWIDDSNYQIISLGAQDTDYAQFRWACTVTTIGAVSNSATVHVFRVIADDWLGEYDRHEDYAIQVGTGYQARRDGVWVDIAATNVAAQGPKGDQGNPGVGLPSVSAVDNGSLARVVSGAWAKVTGIPASLITSGVLNTARIPTISLSKLSTSVVARLLPTGVATGKFLRKTSTGWEGADMPGGGGNQGRGLTDDSVIPAYLDADTNAKKQAFRERINSLSEEDFKPKATDRWFNVNDDFAHWTEDGHGEFGMFAGAPAAGAIVDDQSQDNPDWAGITHVRMMKRGWNSADYFSIPLAPDTDVVAPSVDDTLYVHADDPYNADDYLVLTVTSVDSSDSRYYQMEVTTVVHGTMTSGGNGWLRVTDETPSGVTIPASNVSGVQTPSFLARLEAIGPTDSASGWALAVARGLRGLIGSIQNPDVPAQTGLRTALATFLNTSFATRTLTNVTSVPASFWALAVATVTQAFKSAVRSPRDPYTFTGNYIRRANNTAASVNGYVAFNQDPALITDQNDYVTGAVQMSIRFRTLDLAPAVARWLVHNEFVWGTGTYRIAGAAVQNSGNLYLASVQLIKGTNPTVGHSSAPTLQPDTPHRDELADTAFLTDALPAAPTAADTAKDYKLRVATDGTLSWVED